MTKIGITITLIYVSVVLALRWDSFPDLLTMKLNEFGDFFAGVFGPLMLFWLILGHMQQQKELQQNTKALELQADELKKSVEQHKELVKATKEQVAADVESLHIERARIEQENHPQFVLIGAGLSRKQGDTRTFNINLKNNGKPASNVTFHTEPSITEVEDREPLSHVDTGRDFKVGWSNKKSIEAPEHLLFTIKCLDTKAQEYSVTFELLLEENKYKINSVT